MSPKGTDHDLQSIRRKIDEIDLELLTLLEERMELGLRTRRLKDGPLDARRETSVLTRAKQSSLALVEEDFAGRVFLEVMAESRRLQEEGRKLVAFQGEHGAYGESAARLLVPEAAYIPCMEFEDVFSGVEKGLFDCGVVPVENSLEGAVSHVGGLLSDAGLVIRGEAVVPIHHCLLAPAEADHRELRVAYSHPQALGQCRGFLARTGLEPRPYYDTAGAARMLAKERPRGACAVASALAAHLYGLQVVKEGVEDDASNATRFLLLAREPGEAGNKCSVVFATRHQSGQLYGALELFASAGLNLTRIASAPRRSDPGSYSFFLDFEGSDRDPSVRHVLDTLSKRSPFFRVLGCYPAAQG
jgi:prephenate dehydratase/chorismate mutase